MGKIKVIYSSYPSHVEDDIKKWIKKKPDINIISANGIIRDNGDIITYILYENNLTGFKLNS